MFNTATQKLLLLLYHTKKVISERNESKAKIRKAEDNLRKFEFAYKSQNK